MRHRGSRRRRLSARLIIAVLSILATGVGLLMLLIIMFALTSLAPSTLAVDEFHKKPADVIYTPVSRETKAENITVETSNSTSRSSSKRCATVEEMGEVFKGDVWEESLRVRKLIQNHFLLNGASRVRGLPPEQFCRHGFVMGKSSEAGFGNEMYKVLTGAALSVMLNRSLIIGQTRGKYPFGDYISYSNISFTLEEVKHLWRHNGCVKKFGRHLVMRIDDFEKPAQTNVLCSNWRKWEQPIIWFLGTTDAVAAQFFLKNVHPEMRMAASDLFGHSDSLQARPNVFGELMRVLISPSEDVKEAVNWVLNNGVEPDVSLHMRMLTNRSVRVLQAALKCIRKVVDSLHQTSRPKIVLVSDTPSFPQSIAPNISEFAEVFHFDYKRFRGSISHDVNRMDGLEFRAKDWGPAPRWVAFVDFFLAARAKHAVVYGAFRRVGTTYAQLIAALAAANSLDDNSTGLSFLVYSSFQSNLLREGLRFQTGWGHVWNRFAGPLSCHNQSHQCAFTPLLPPAWWDGLWQSPHPRDIQRLAAYGVQLSGMGTIDDTKLQSFCSSKKNSLKTVTII
ncbi:uncharacterized protein LOC123222513 [Mangifera indica]|uniref:uncharacterized protein LOC123222513 n=1 Tax=Mangifera indica TaxID=29780 RepID=UPI001CF9A6F8|nr:uncharacterized protein LOC123222513 [Mangifera indica]